MKTVLVVAEYLNDKIAPITDELIASALEISAIINKEIKYAESKTSEVKVVHVKGLNTLASEQYKSALVSIIQELNPSFILMGHTSQGIDTAFGLAARLRCNCISSVNKVIEHKKKYLFGQGSKNDDNDKSDILFFRSIFKGKLNAVIKLENPDKMTLLTVQPGSFAPKEADIDIIEITLYASAANSHQIEYENIIEPQTKKSKLDQAKIIVSAGRGIEDQENIAYIERLAACFTGSAVGGSRPLIDMGWMPYHQQVGITGAVVSPELYIAVGISGSSQHIAGMKDSKFIVSINKDPNAAVFNLSDVCIVEDAVNFIKSYVETAEE
ncbi:MAG: electron transfer flavoprotein subunit alpha/FixB family protein [Desulfamplus sp.]|nr:electron transfer flavoprotein subunit alpha/FixB family protein [Desulfamplus sp.]MBF0411940.1 electron transfer flavoprotein subunit alpha/FixB family protein [Desulfamplus sp.]